jgi:hypothetical protein
MAGHEPSRLVGDAQHAGQLVPGHVLLAAAYQMVGMEPDIQGDLGAFKHGAHSDAKGLLARIAPIDARSGRFAPENSGFTGDAAMGTNRAGWPQEGLQMTARGRGIGETGRNSDGQGYNPLCNQNKNPELLRYVNYITT